MQVIRHFTQSKAQAARTASWRHKRIHVWRGQRITTDDLSRRLTLDVAARRRDAICRLMEDNAVPNTERGHRQAYDVLWTACVRHRLGDPPRPATLVRWRRKRAAVTGASITPVVLHPRRMAGKVR